MKVQHRKIAERNAMQYKAATIQAAYLVRSDARLLGLPKTRDPLIETSALRAIGIQDAKLDIKVYGHLAPESQDVVMEVFARAIEAGQAAIADMPPARLS